MTQNTRRPHGTGSVFQRARDGRWVATIDHGYTASGGRRRITVTAATESAAKTRLKERQRAIARDEEASSRTTVKAWADAWLPIVAKQNRPSSHNADRIAVRRWIVPTIGHKRLDQLTPGDVRAVAAAVTDAGNSSSTARRYVGTLQVMLKAAVDDGKPVPARVLAVRKPAVAVNDREAMTPEDAVLILDQASRTPSGSRYVAALLQGIRQGEALGLMWDHVDLDAGVLLVEWQLKALPYNVPRDRSSGFRVPEGYKVRRLAGAHHLVDVKTKAGVRIVPIVPWFGASLERWQAEAIDSPHGLVWPRADGRPATADADDAGWYALQDAAGVRHRSRLDKHGRPAYYTIHEARHTTATLLLEAGVDPVVVGQILGQSSLVATRGYQHVRDVVAREALDRVATRLQLGG